MDTISYHYFCQFAMYFILINYGKWQVYVSYIHLLSLRAVDFNGAGPASVNLFKLWFMFMKLKYLTAKANYEHQIHPPTRYLPIVKMLIPNTNTTLMTLNFKVKDKRIKELHIAWLSKSPVQWTWHPSIMLTYITVRTRIWHLANVVMLKL